ncbi:MAG: hypothetical protein VXY81_14485, partial [Pseudomonadota bacterium]|nr:hypothetical protein [Pseudomonadota bacterium]
AVAPAGCPVDHGFSPYRSDYLKNPYPGLRDLRTKTPVFYAAELGYVVLTRMADVAEVFKHADVFSSEIVQHPVLPICAAARAALDVPDYAPIAVMSNCAPPDHARIRKHTLAGFSAHRMRVLAPYIRTRAETLVAQMLADGEPAEFVRAGGRPLTWLFGLSRVTSAACFTAALVYVSLVEASLLGLMSVTGATLMAWPLRGGRPGRAEFVCHTILVGGVVSLALLVEDGWRNPTVLL